MGKLLNLMAAFLLVLFLPGLVSAAELSLGSWQATGYQMWRTSFPTSMNNASTGASELYYPHSGTYLISTYHNHLSAKRALRIEAGIMGSIKPGTGSDSDWKNQTDKNKWYYGEFTSSGKSVFIKADWIQVKSNHLEHFYGYSYRDNSFLMTDGIYFTEDSQPSEPYPRPLAGLASTYKMLYQGPHIGWKYSSTPGGKLTTVSTITYTPIAYVHGHGWWNLRNLHFSHDGAGQILDGSLALRYAPTDRATVTLGYRYQFHSLFRGWENLSSDISWDKATNIQQGLFFNARMVF